jgi:hypothetical protein
LISVCKKNRNDHWNGEKRRFMGDVNSVKLTNGTQPPHPVPAFVFFLISPIVVHPSLNASMRSPLVTF